MFWHFIRPYEPIHFYKTVFLNIKTFCSCRTPICCLPLSSFISYSWSTLRLSEPEQSSGSCCTHSLCACCSTPHRCLQTWVHFPAFARLLHLLCDSLLAPPAWPALHLQLACTHAACLLTLQTQCSLYSVSGTVSPVRPLLASSLCLYLSLITLRTKT